MAVVDFEGGCRPCLIGSLPFTDHAEATRLVWEHTPEIASWVQLPRLAGESIAHQFAAGMPGLVEEGDRIFVDAGGGGFERSLVEFYAEALALDNDPLGLDRSRFAMAPETARGLLELIVQAKGRTPAPTAMKGQIIGAVTFGTTICDRNGRAIFYDPQLGDASVRLLGWRARWQVRRLAAMGRPVLLFIDDPAISGFGSSVYMGLSREDIQESLDDMITAVHLEGALAGVHVCANAEWELVLDSAADVLSFDAYTFFEQFVIYREPIRRFLDRGGVIAWGLVPTLLPEDLERATIESLLAQWEEKSARLATLGIDPERLRAQSMITPACGMGTLSEALALKALHLTRELSSRIRGAPAGHRASP